MHIFTKKTGDFMTQLRWLLCVFLSTLSVYSSLVPMQTTPKQVIKQLVLARSYTTHQLPKNHVIKTLQTISSLAKNTSRETLVLKDLDNTVFTQQEVQATDHYYSIYKREQQALGVGYVWATIEAVHKFNNAQDSALVKPVENSVSTAIKDLQKNKIALIGLTARAPKLAHATEKQLHSLGIKFNDGSDLTSHQCTLNLAHSPYPTLYSNGIVYCDHNNKGRVLLALLEGLNLNFDAIVHVEDKYKNLKAVSQALAEKKPHIKYMGLHYTYLDIIKLKACKEIIKKLTHEEVVELYKELGFSDEQISDLAKQS